MEAAMMDTSYGQITQDPSRRRRRAYTVRERRLSTDYTDVELKTHTRLTRFQYNYLLGRIGPLIASDSNSALTISADTKLLAVLEALGTGEHQWALARKYGFSQQKMSVFIGEVVEAINTLMPEFIRLPNPEEMRQSAEVFQEQCGLPDVIGCIDGTLINIQTPYEEGEAFVDRKGNHSINVQLVCDAGMKIWNVNASWPGSINDVDVFNVSDLKSCFTSNHFGTFKLLGDEGYFLQPYLLTPYKAPQTPLQKEFNALLTMTRSVIERCIGLLKGRWRRLHPTSRELMYTPGKVCRMVLAACILHNLCFLTEDGDIFDVTGDTHLMVCDERDSNNVAVGEPADYLRQLRDEYVESNRGDILRWRIRRRYWMRRQMRLRRQNRLKRRWSH